MTPRSHSLFWSMMLSAVSFVSVLPAAEPVIDLWPEGVPGLKPDATPEKEENERVSNVHRPTLTVFVPPAGTANGTAMVVAPGGGYMRLAMGHEGVDVARWLNSLGVTAFVLRYRMVEYGHPAPLRDALRALRTVRSRAEEFGVRADRVGMIGFSAGGHLTASAATLFDSPEGRTGAELDAKVSARPDFAILMYPVITLKDPHAHAGSRRALLGADATAEAVAAMSLESRVTNETPPTFIVHTQDDRTVPVENAVAFYLALRNAQVPVEMHLYEKGGHGFGLRPGHGQTSDWPKRAEAWMRGHGWLP